MRAAIVSAVRVTGYNTVKKEQIMRIPNIVRTLCLIVVLVATYSFAGSNYEPEKIKTLSGDEITIAEMDKYLKNQMDSMNVTGLSIAVINDANVVYHRTFGYMDINSKEIVDDYTIFEAASLSKPIFAYFVMKMAEKGTLDLDTPLYKYLPYPDIEHDARYKLITARIVLNHTSGFPNWRTDNQGGKLDIKFTPGTKFSYSGEGYTYLAKVIAHLTNRDLSNLDSLFQQEVSKPLNLEHAHFGMNAYVAKHLATAYDGNRIVYDPSWDRKSFGAAGGLYTEAMSYANFLIAIMEDKGLKKESINEMLKEQVQIPDNDDYRKLLGVTEWGLGFGRKPSIYGINYTHIGNNVGYTASFMINKDKKFGYVFFTNSNQRIKLIQNLEAFLANRSDSSPYFIDYEGMQ